MLKLAWRNLWRNYTRTFIIGSAIAFSYAMMLVSLGINSDSHGKLRDAAEVAAGGNVLIHSEGFWESQASDLVLQNPTELIDQARAIPGVAELIPRILINGLVSSSRGNEPAHIRGILPDKERLLSDVSTNLIAGEFLGDTYPSPIVLSQNLVEQLKIELGDKVVLTASTPDGEVTRALFHLDGIIKSGVAGEAGSIAYTTLAAASAAVQMQDRISQIGVLAAPGFTPETLAKNLKQTLPTGTSDALEILTWEQAIPEMKGLLEFDQAFGYIYLFVIFVIVLLAIANTFLMAVMERVREYGLLNAIGLTPGRIGQLVVWEAALLGAMAIVVGFVVALILHLIIAHVGIDLASLGADDVEMAGVGLSDMVIRSRFEADRWFFGGACVFVIVMISALYPALRAMRLAPAQAMRFYE